MLGRDIGKLDTQKGEGVISKIVEGLVENLAWRNYKNEKFTMPLLACTHDWCSDHFTTL